MSAQKTNGAQAQSTSNGHGAAHASANGHSDVQGLVDRIVEHASRAFEDSQALPAEYYLSPELYELELEKIFRRDWMYICRADEIANPGDWYAFELAGESVVVVRGEDNEVRALSRVCPHRFMDVLGEEDEVPTHGHAETFVCPYHAWAYKLDGSLAGAPLMERSRHFERERDTYCLKQYATEVWHGFVFVNLDPDAEPLAPRFAELEEIIEPFRIEEWKLVDRVDWPETEASWKLAMDNGRECYHHIGAHKVSVEPLWPAHLVDADTTDAQYYYYQRLHVDPAAAVGQEDGHYIQPTVLPPPEGLTPYHRSHSLLIGIYPTMWFIPGPDVMFVAKWWPTGPTTHKFELAICVHESHLELPDLEKTLAEVKEWANQIQVEDARMVTGIQRMLTSSAAGDGGALSHLERPVWTFQRYMAERLGGATF